MIDVHRIEENEEEKHIFSGLMEFALKNKKIQNFRAFLKKLLPWLDQVEIALGGDFGKIVLQYVLRDIDFVDRQVFVEEINQYTSSTIRRTTMTLAEQFREEGFQKGLKKGKTLAEQFREEGFQKGLKKGKTLAEQFREEGLQKGLNVGLEEGRIEATKAMAIKMLDNGISIPIIANVTGLSSSEIQALQKEKVDA